MTADEWRSATLSGSLSNQRFRWPAELSAYISIWLYWTPIVIQTRKAFYMLLHIYHSCSSRTTRRLKVFGQEPTVH